jgi:hypothetical protein
MGVAEAQTTDEPSSDAAYYSIGIHAHPCYNSIHEALYKKALPLEGLGRATLGFSNLVS